MWYVAVGQAVTERISKQINKVAKKVSATLALYNALNSGSTENANLPNQSDTCLKDVYDPMSDVYSDLAAEQVGPFELFELFEPKSPNICSFGNWNNSQL